jgi:membrane associated rhomboid family serine protease
VLIPIGDDPNPPRAQWLTRILIGINVAVFLFITLPLENRSITPEDKQDPAFRAVLDEMWQANEGWVLREGYSRAEWEGAINHYNVFTFEYGYKPGKPNILALFLCMFLHAGFLHLAGNMLFLWIFGDNVEYRLGTVWYLVAYLLTGVAATLSFAAFDWESLTPLIGASGAISGVLGFYFVWFPHNRVRVLFFFFLITIFELPALVVLGFYLFVDNVLPFLVSRQVGEALGGVAHAAHIGGFIAGMAAAWLFKGRFKPRIEPARARPGAWRPPKPVAAPKVKDPGAAFEDAVRTGRMEDAAHAFARLAREGGRKPHPAPVFQLARWLYDNDFTSDAAAVFRYYLRAFPRGEDLDRVNLGLGVLLARRLGKPAAARQYLLTAIELAGSDRAISDRAREELARIDAI